MILENSVKIKNYKCFDSDLQGFDKIYPINVIIGKNNSGKSSLIELINFLFEPKTEFIDFGRSGKKSEVVISTVITKNESIEIFPLQVIIQNQLYDNSDYKKGTALNGKTFDYFLEGNGERKLVENQDIFKNLEKESIRKFIDVNIFPSVFHGKNLFRISAERDIQKEIQGGFSFPLMNGVNATNFIREIINNSSYDRTIIEKKLLVELNNIVNPDIEFTDIVVEHDNENLWEIKFRDKDENYIALSNMGSGIKTILLVLINLIAIPAKQKEKPDKYVFAFEELENNLHPSLLRRLFNYIIKYAEQNNCYFFITTHSSIVIDLFGSKSNAQIIHVQKDKGHSIVHTVVSDSATRKILKDLDVKASDLLLSNGILWVEGPSDAVYLELLLDLYNISINDTKIESLNYSIQALSTALWKYAGFQDFEWSTMSFDLQNKIISLAKLNHNHLIVIDNDGNYENYKPAEWGKFMDGNGKNKAKLIHESMKFSQHDEEELNNIEGDTHNGKLFFWVTEGTFETYLKFFIENKGKESFKKYFGSNLKNGYFEKKREGANHSISKVVLAHEIAKFIYAEKLTIHDIAPVDSPLKNKIERLYATIKSWN